MTKDQIERASLGELTKRSNELQTQFMAGAAWPAADEIEFEDVQREILRRTADCGTV